MAGRQWVGRKGSVFWWSAGLAVLWSAVLCGQTDRPPQAGDPPLEQFLQARGLDRLLIRQVEMQLAREFDPENQVVLGRRLAGLYQAALLSEQWQEIDSAIIERSGQLLANYPAVGNAGLRLAVEHARYRDVEMAFRQWWYQGRDPARQGEAAGDLVASYDRLSNLTARLETDVRQAQILPEATPAEVAGKDRVLTAVEGRLAHCHYLLGWASYYRGILDNQGASAWLLKSQKYFQQFLQLPPEGPLPDLNTWPTDLQLSWQWRSLLGIAMGLRARGDHQESDAMFQFLAKTGADSVEGQWLEAWNLESMVLARQWDRAADYLAQVSTGSWGRGKQRAFWRRVLQASRAASLSAPERADFMRVQALLSLVRNRESSVLQQWMDERQTEGVSNAFVRGWVEGYLGWVKAEQGGDALIEVGKTLSSAIQAADESVLAEDLARCRFLRALVDFRTGQLVESAKEFAEVSQALQKADPQMAAESSWMNVQAWIAMAMLDRRRTSEALAAIDQFASRFPASLAVEELPFQKLRLSCQALPPRQALERLVRFQLSHPEVHQVRMELVRCHYRDWQDQFQSNRQAAQAALTELQRFDRQLQEDPQIGDPQKLRSVLWVIDAMLQMDVANAEIEALLQTAIALADTPNISADMNHLLAYYQMMFARQSGDQEMGIALARELVTQSAGTPFERSALLYLVESYPTNGELDPDNRTAAIADLARLVELLGDDARSLTRSRNSRVALFRLSELCLQDRQWERADQYLDQLVNVFPERREYLAASARAKTERDHFERALPRWRFLANRVEPGTDLWYEAKYQLVRCLWSTGDANAKTVFRQTMQLSPSMPETWARQYALLAKQIELGD
ncbi:MAG: hypothetical protein MK108_02615 [Mariniblastus sp.]|nr:hypothetical protein [Mariniblastus sp.]